MIAALILMSTATDPSVLMHRAARRLSARPWSLASADPTPRLATAQTAPVPTMKDVALREDGTRCSLIGARVCTNPPRTWVSAGF